MKILSTLIFSSVCLFAVNHSTSNADSGKIDNNLDEVSIVVQSQDSGVAVDGKVSSQDKGQSFKKKFKASFSGNFGSKSRKSTGSDVYVGPNEEVDDVLVVGGDAFISGHVLGDVKVIGGDIILERGAVIEGDVINIGGSIERAKDIVIKGSITKGLSKETLKFPLTAIASILSIGSTFVIFLIYMFWLFSILFVVGLLAHYIFPVASINIKKAIVDNPVLCFFVGLIAMISFVPLNLILMITIIWIFFIPFFAVTFFLLSCWGMSQILTAIGEKLPIKREVNAYVDFILGFAILFILSMIPILGKFVIFIIGTIGIGSIIVSKFGRK